MGRPLWEICLRTRCRAFLEKTTKVETPGSGEAAQTPGWACNHLISRDTRLFPDTTLPQLLTVQQDPLGRLLYLLASGPRHRQLHWDPVFNGGRWRLLEPSTGEKAMEGTPRGLCSTQAQ